MTQITAMLCAEKIAGLAKARGVIDVSNLKLQKLVYYSQAWHLAIYGKPLFSDPIEAWVHGPVVRSVFTEYKYGKLQPVDCEPLEDAHLFDVFNAYGSFAGSQLERMTHSEKPWIDARKGLARDAPSRNVISVATMREFYSALIDG